MHACSRIHILALVALASLSACAAKVDSSGIPAAETVAVVVEPGTASLATGQATKFDATVTGTADLGIVWSVDEPGGGQVDQNGLYTAPATAGSYHVRAASHAKPEISGVASVSVAVPPAGSVVISPKSTSVSVGGTVTFTARVDNLTSSAVTWKVQEASGCGSVSASGAYTAPPAAATCHVIATSSSDASKSDTATVTVLAALAISISPTTGTVDACRTLQLSATVTGGGSDHAVVWSVSESGGGTVSSTGLYTAPSSAATYHVVAAAHASAAVTAQAAVTVKDHILSITVNPPSASLSTGGSQRFTATVTTTCGDFAASSP